MKHVKPAPSKYGQGVNNHYPMTRTLLRTVLALLILTATGVFAQTNVYIRSGQSGNGSAWNNARGCVPGSGHTRGTTYWVADGDYSGCGVISFATPADGTKQIVLKKATIASHGDSTGWSDAFGDGQAILSGITITAGHLLIDGQVECDDITQCTRGFVVNASGVTARWVVLLDGGPDNITIKSLTVDPGAPNEYRGIRACCGSGGQNLTIENVEVVRVGDDCIHLDEYAGVMLDRFYCHIRNMAPGSTVHSDAVSLSQSPPVGGAKNTLRNSIIDWQGQQFWFGGTGVPPEGGQWDIYGNVFRSTCGTTTASVSAIKSHADATLGPLNVFNNSIFCVFNAFALQGVHSGTVKNNIFFNLTSGMGVGFNDLTHDFNYFDTALGLQGEANGQTGGNPFVSISGGDYHLTKATNPGTPLASPFNVDYFGIVRGADGVWDRGAYEFGSQSSTRPEPPQNLRVTVR